MNEVIENIINRRSIREFTNESIDSNTINEIILAGLYAPSSKNKQSWHFTVIEKREIIEKLNKDTKEAILKYGDEVIENKEKLERLKAKANNENYDGFYNAPVAILISKDEKDKSSEEDCAMASQNIMLAAEAFDLGSCWVSFVKNLFKLDKVKAKEYANEFSIPEGYVTTHAIVIGHSHKNKDEIKAQERKENVVTYVK